MPSLAEEGISVDLIPFVDDAFLKVLHKPGMWGAKFTRAAAAFLRRITQIAATSRYDAVLIHRAASLAGPAVLERAIAILRRPIIFDFDDAIYMLHTTEANRKWGWLKFPGKTETICRLSTHVVVGNSFLAEYARRSCPDVTVIPSSVDTNRFRPASRRDANGRIVVGWTGSSTSQTYLEAFAPVLRELIKRHNVEVRIHSDRKPALEGLPIEWRPWSPETEAEEIARFDIGIMPMPHDPWANGKCAMKALLYMASGVPTICEAVGTNREVIRHRENGLLAATPEEWIACLDDLITDRALRDHLRSEGRRTIEEKYSMKTCAELFARVVRGIQESRVSARQRLNEG
jgi:glycosyltransferase involved in cell wall biosynthesis